MNKFGLVSFVAWRNCKLQSHGLLWKFKVTIGEEMVAIEKLHLSLNEIVADFTFTN